MFGPVLRDETVRRTCPQVYACSPFYLSLLDDLDDYDNNRLGNINELPAAYLFYMRVLSAECKAWRTWWEEELMPDPPKKN